ncbi:MAG: single-stranded DNA-binding protein [Sandaracinaceae bacterium]|nr:single-stranded DNA-binding protein [Sandaracinaceae bacterium]
MPHIGLNRVLLIGDVASEPRFKLTPERKLPRLWFRVRTEEAYRGADEQERTRSSYHTVVVWGDRAQALRAFLRPGHTVAIEGRLSTSVYELAGKKRYETEVVATSVVVLTPRDAREHAA